MRRSGLLGLGLIIVVVLTFSVWSGVSHAAGAADWNHSPIPVNSGNLGYHTDIAVDTQRKVHISYHDEVYSFLMYATNATATGAWTNDMLTSGDYTSIAVDANGKVYMSYSDGSKGFVASGNTGSWYFNAFDAPHISEGTSIAVDSAGMVHVSYHDALSGSLKYAKGVTGPSGGWTPYVVDNGTSLGNANSIALDSQGNIHISYFDSYQGHLKYAMGVPGSSGPTWSINTLDSSTGAGVYNSIAVDANDHVHISYYDPSTWYLKYALGVPGPSGMIWSYDTIDSSGGGDIAHGRYNSIAVDANGNVHVSYQESTHGYLKYALGVPGPSGMTWSTSDIDITGNTGYDTAIAVDSSNMVSISYRDANTTGGGLKYIYNGYDLAVTKTGDGYGSVLSSPPGITCDLENTDCSDVYGPGSVVTLKAIPGSESYFGGWSWLCGGDVCTSNALTVKITMDQAKEVTATFTSTPPSIQTWAKTYGGDSLSDIAQSIQQTSDGGYIVAGIRNSFALGYGDFWVLKLNSDGSIAWQKTYGVSNSDAANSIQQTSDGGYIAAGFTGAGSSHDFWVLKLNSDGSVAWQKTYGGSGYDSANSIQQTSDGGYIIAGFTDSLVTGSDDFWVLKLNSDGSIAWQKTYGGMGYDYANSIQQTSDGGYIVAGRTDSFGSGSDDFWMLKLNSAGSIAWQKTYGGSGYDYASSIQQTSDGGYIVAGSTDSFGSGSDDFLVLKLNSDGSVAWQKTYGGMGYDYANSIQQTTDGGYIVAGRTDSFGSGSDDFWVLKLNSDGSVAWQKTYGNGSDANSIQQTSDGGYIVAGIAYGNSFLVLKLDPGGNITDCSGITIQDTSVSPVDSTATVSDTSVTGVITDVIPQTTNITPTDTTVSDVDACSVPSAPHLSVAPLSPYHFGNVNTGSSATQTFTITNTGDAALVIMQIGSEDTLAPPFSISSDHCTDHTLQPLGSCIFVASFAPSTAGQFTDTFDISSNDPNSPMTVELQGVGVVPTYTLNVTKLGTGTGTVTSNETTAPKINCGSTCSASYTAGSSVTLNAAASSNSTFAGWLGAGCSGTGSCTFIMNSNNTVSAVFNKTKFTVTPIADQHGTMNPSVPQEVSSRATVSFTITPDPGYSILSVSGSCGGTLSGNVYTTNPVTADCDVRTSFARTTLRVTASAGQGGVISPTSATVNYGETLQLTVTPDDGYHIASVAGCGVTKYEGGVIAAKKKKKNVKGAAAGEIYITGPVTADCAVSATFAIDTFTVTPIAGEHGSMNPSTPRTVNYNGTASFDIAAEEGYHIESVSGCGGTAYAATAKKKKKKKLAALSGMTYTTGKVTGDCSVTASFAINSFTVTGKAGDHGSIDPSGAQKVNYHDKISFTVTPDKGYHIASVSGCGVQLSEGDIYTTEPVTGDCTVEVAFAKDIFTATVLKSGSGNGTVTGSGMICDGETCTGSYETGTKLTLKIKPDTGSKIIDVKINGKSIGAVQTITLKEIISNFTIEIIFGPA